MSSGVEFEGDNTQYSKPQTSSGGNNAFNSSPSNYNYSPSQPKGFVGWLIGKGIVKSEKTAQVFLFGVVAVNIAITLLVIKLFL